jgi:hypothetical protein
MTPLPCQRAPAGTLSGPQPTLRMKRRHIKARQHSKKSNVHQLKGLVTSGRSMQTEGWGAFCNICPDPTTSPLLGGANAGNPSTSIVKPTGFAPAARSTPADPDCIACATLLLEQYMKRRHCPPFPHSVPISRVHLAGISATATVFFASALVPSGNEGPLQRSSSHLEEGPLR